ncbi:MAG TPA: hypothetical protein VGM73_08135 [Candidatus Didemnitutus sp.]
MSVASRYGSAQLRPFVESWKRHVAEAELVVFADRLPTEAAQYLEDAGVRVIPARFNLGNPTGWRKAWLRLGAGGWLRLLGVIRGRLGLGAHADSWHEGISEAAFHLYAQRFFCYRRFLAQFGWKYSDVLLVDIRDTLFQVSPFPSVGLHVFAENETIAQSHFARRWFQLSYGNRTFRRLGSFPLLCAGVTLGDGDSIRAYLECNCAESLKIAAVNDIDQAVHNYMVHRGLVPATIHAFGQGPAINLNAMSLASLTVKNGRLLSADGRPFAIVHQYDRVVGLELAG